MNKVLILINKRFQLIVVSTVLLLLPLDVMALDSYRFMHVTIETPWMIFLFLLPGVLAPLIVMAILYWRFAGRKPDTYKDDGSDKDSDSSHNNEDSNGQK